MKTTTNTTASRRCNVKVIQTLHSLILTQADIPLCTTTATSSTTTTAFSTITNRTEDICVNEFAQSPGNPVDLSGNVPMIYSPVIQPFSIFDQNVIMNGFTNLSVPWERQSQTQFLSVIKLRVICFVCLC